MKNEMKKSEMMDDIIRLLDYTDQLENDNDQLTQKLKASEDNLRLQTKQRDEREGKESTLQKRINELLKDIKTLKTTIKEKDKAFSDLSWQMSQTDNQDINPPSTELRFKQITAVPAGDFHWLYGLTEDGQILYKTAEPGCRWNKEPTLMDTDS